MTRRIPPAVAAMFRRSCRDGFVTRQRRALLRRRIAQMQLAVVIAACALIAIVCLTTIVNALAR
jgi:hypothetical protein